MDYSSSVKTVLEEGGNPNGHETQTSTQKLSRNLMKNFLPDQETTRSSVWGTWFMRQGGVFSADNPIRNRNHLATLEILFRYGANPNGNYGNTTIWIAFLRFLIEAKSNRQNESRSKAEWNFYFEVVFKFLCYNANLDLTVGPYLPLPPISPSSISRGVGRASGKGRNSPQKWGSDLEQPLPTIFGYFSPYQSILLMQALNANKINEHMQMNAAWQNTKMRIAIWVSTSQLSIFGNNLCQSQKRLWNRLLSTVRSDEEVPEDLLAELSWLSQFVRWWRRTRQSKNIQPYSPPALRPMDDNELNAVPQPRKRSILSKIISWVFYQLRRILPWSTREAPLPARSFARLPLYWRDDEFEPLLGENSL
jgi:hypothetical protein